MSTLASMQPAAPIPPIHWLMPGLMPFGELILLDGPVGVGKSLIAAGLAAQAATHPELNKPGSILYLLSPQQSEPAIEFLANQNPNYDRIHRLEYEPDPQAIANNTTIAFHIFLSIQSAILKHQPRLIIIDSLEELLEPGGETDGKTLHELWDKLSTLAKLAHCTLLIPRKNGLHENRQYGPFTRFGSEAARFALTLGWHPTDPSIRIMTLAKHQRGPVGEQTRVHIQHEGKVVFTYTDPHEHLRPAKSPATWQPDSPHAHEDEDIIKFVEGLMHGLPQPKIEIMNYVTKAGFSKTAFERAMSKAKLKTIKSPDARYLFPTPHMIFRANQKRAERQPTLDSALSTQDLKNPPQNQTRAHDTATTEASPQPGRLMKSFTPTTVRQAG